MDLDPQFSSVLSLSLTFYFLSFQNLVISSSCFDQPCSSAKVNIASQFCSCCAAALVNLPGLFEHGIKCLLRGLSRFHVLFENIPDFFLLGAFFVSAEFQLRR